MTTCIDCGEEFTKGERRGDSMHGYIGYYCEDCAEERRESE